MGDELLELLYRQVASYKQSKRKYQRLLTQVPKHDKKTRDMLKLGLMEIDEWVNVKTELIQIRERELEIGDDYIDIDRRRENVEKTIRIQEKYKK